MKKIFFVGTMFFLINVNAKAQTSHTEFGLKGGVNIASIHNSVGNDFDSKVGFHIGGLAHIHMTPHFALQPEIVYSLQGGEAGNTNRNLSYINVPVLAQYMAGNGFRLQTGPQVGLLVGANDETNDVEVKTKDQLNTAEFGWSFGASYITHSGFGVDARYNLGLSNINESEAIKSKNRVFQAGVFYQFKH